MDAFLFLAGAFAAIIILGCGLVYLHDLLERRRAAPRVSAGHFGQAAASSLRASPRPPTSSAPSVVVWVRAGENAVRVGGGRVVEEVDQRVVAHSR